MTDLAQVEECTLDRKITRSAAAQVAPCKEECLRRSVRDPSIAMMDRNDLSILLERIRTNHPSTVVFKIKDHLIADISSSVFDAIIEALWKNKVCQGLYVQNLAKAIGDTQLHALVELLKKKMIWCLNIGESYEISMDGWRFFCASLHKTNVTHLYVSEHTIPIDLKNEMRDHIRDNRQKHNLHRAFKNLSVIERCTHMWWNPINGVKELKPPPPTPEPESEEEEEEEVVPVVIELTPAHTAYWQEGVGEGGDKPWKFKCTCGETCSSYENFRYHPTGRMFECSNPACCLWSHVNCVLGPQFTDKELETRKDLLCGACKAKSRRLSKYMGVSITELNAPASAASDTTATTAKAGKDATSKASNSSRPGDEEDGKPWTFRCKCGEVCSSYEKEMYHPAGQWYECSQCCVWSHVHCMLGKATPEQILEMKEVLCFSCTTKARRSRSRGTVEPAPKPAPASALPVTAATHREATCLRGPSVYPAVSPAVEEPACHVSQSSEPASAHVAAPAQDSMGQCASNVVVTDEQAAFLQEPTLPGVQVHQEPQSLSSCAHHTEQDLLVQQELTVSEASCLDDEQQCDDRPSTGFDKSELCTAEALANKRKHDLNDEREQKAARIAQHPMDEL